MLQEGAEVSARCCRRSVCVNRVIKAESDLSRYLVPAATVGVPSPRDPRFRSTVPPNPAEVPDGSTTDASDGEVDGTGKGHGKASGSGDVDSGSAAPSDSGGKGGMQLEHPWAVRPTKRGRSTDLSEEELARLRAERELSDYHKVKWQHRGPPVVDESSPSCWRGQAYRVGVNGGQSRFANRGGKNREWYAEQARKGRLPSQNGGGTKGSGKDRSYV